ncbi:MAG: translation initiation factor IF-2 N-terminal domain-containing protein, partial [Actinomycetota bacterium]
MSKNVRVSTLAKELGMSSKEVVDLCNSIGIGASSASSSMVDAQADRVRRHAEEKGLKREPAAEKPKKAKKPSAKSEAEGTEAPEAKKASKPRAKKATAPVEESTAPAVTTTAAPVATPAPLSTPAPSAPSPAAPVAPAAASQP